MTQIKSISRLKFHAPRFTEGSFFFTLASNGLRLMTLIIYFMIWSAEANSTESPQLIRVRVAEGVSHLIARGYDLQISGNDLNKKKWSATTDRVSEWEMRCQDGQIRARLIFSTAQPKGSNQIWELKEPVRIESKTGFLKLNNLQYREELNVYSAGLLCDVTNQMDIEKYLDGLVNAEFSSSWHPEAIAAQVVAARTYAYFQMMEARAKGRFRFDLDASIKDQMYSGVIKEDYRASQVVRRSRGQILVEKYKIKPIKAFYHSICGGKTELPENVWGTALSYFKQSRPCPYCGQSPYFRWVLKMSQTELIRGVRRGIKVSGLPPHWPIQLSGSVWDGVELLDIQTQTFASSPRNNTITLSWKKDNAHFDSTLSAVLFRDWLGTTVLKSTWFQVSEIASAFADRKQTHALSTEKKWQFTGQGYGHGVGLCQWGAKTMGELGHSMESILKFYYPDAFLQKVW